MNDIMSNEQINKLHNKKDQKNSKKVFRKSEIFEEKIQYKSEIRVYSNKNSPIEPEKQKIKEITANVVLLDYQKFQICID